MRWMTCIGIVIAVGSCKPDLYFIPGTGTLADCAEAPITDLDGTVWFNQGPITILTEGCLDTAPDDTFDSCPEDWYFTQDGNDIDIVVDEYRVKGRLCGDQLSLEGGWWLSVTNEQGGCDYEDDDGDDLGMQAGGNVLTVDPVEETMTGTLLMQGRCGVRYEVILEPVRRPPPPG